MSIDASCNSLLFVQQAHEQMIFPFAIPFMSKWVRGFSREHGAPKSPSRVEIQLRPGTSDSLRLVVLDGVVHRTQGGV